jgi:hypothetical protein
LVRRPASFPASFASFTASFASFTAIFAALAALSALLAFSSALLAFSSAPLAAQGFAATPKVQPEFRVEAIVARSTSALVMAGANVPVGAYVRVGAAAGAGAVAVGGEARLARRADFTLRFLLDPFAETRWGPYAGGGLTVRRDGEEDAIAGLLFVLGVEGRRGRRWSPAVEVALGEGVRLAVVWRRSRANAR